MAKSYESLVVTRESLKERIVILMSKNMPKYNNNELCDNSLIWEMIDKLSTSDIDEILNISNTGCKCKNILQFAVFTSNYEIVEKILKYKNPNMNNRLNKNVLSEIWYYNANACEIAKLLLQYNARTDAFFHNHPFLEWTIYVMDASLSGLQNTCRINEYIELIKLFIDNGAVIPKEVHIANPKFRELYQKIILNNDDN